MHCVGLMEFMNLKVHIGDRNLFPLFLNSYVFRTMKSVFETKELLVSRLVFTVVCRWTKDVWTFRDSRYDSSGYACVL